MRTGRLFCSCFFAVVMSASIDAGKVAAQEKGHTDHQHHPTGEILDWIVKNGSGGGMRYNSKGENDFTDSVEIQKGDHPCSLAISRNVATYQERQTEVIFQGTLLELSILSPTVDIQETDLGPSPPFRLLLHTTNNEPKIHKKESRETTTTETRKSNREFVDDSQLVYVKDEDMARRMATAFKDAITQCGGKPDVKNIY